MWPREVDSCMAVHTVYSNEALVSYLLLLLLSLLLLLFIFFHFMINIVLNILFIGSIKKWLPEEGAKSLAALKDLYYLIVWAKVE